MLETKCAITFIFLIKPDPKEPNQEPDEMPAGKPDEMPAELDIDDDVMYSNDHAW